jgi:putative SOS response-associated peptidase YedK
MVPPWAKDSKISRHTYNARFESVSHKPSFRSAWHHAQFALVVADWFYEPCYETGKAQRWRIGLTNKEPMGIAGLWERWQNPQTGQVEASFTMITINAQNHPLMSRMHKPDDEKRTPVVLSNSSFESWLCATPEGAPDLLRLDRMAELQGESLV